MSKKSNFNTFWRAYYLLLREGRMKEKKLSSFQGILGVLLSTLKSLRLFLQMDKFKEKYTEQFDWV